MLALARSRDGGLLPARRIADSMGIPVRFLPQVLRDLQRGGFVEAELGRAGGYRLTRDPATVDLLSIIEAVEGDSRRRSCVLRRGPCGNDDTCDVHDVFSAGQEALLATLASVTLDDLVRRGDSTGVHGDPRP
jgi:Rrf2 family protein